MEKISHGKYQKFIRHPAIRAIFREADLDPTELYISILLFIGVLFAKYRMMR